LALTGLYFLSVTETLTINKGDVFVFVSAFFWAFHVLAISHFAPKVNVILLSFLQFAVCAVLSMLSAMFFEEYSMHDIYLAAIPILYGGLLAVGVAFTLQIYAQKVAPPSHAAIILSLEAFFAALGGWLILNEELSSRKIIGCLLMLAGVIFSQLNAKKNKVPD
jgi:drug/metabolite transporter (DMT)-like permease